MVRESKPFNYGDLYVMQVESGLIKVGRSVDVAKRRLEISKYVGQQVWLVADFPGQGADEEPILKMLRPHLVVNEWFLGTDIVRNALEQLLGIGANKWPCSWDPTAADDLWSHLRFMRDRAYLRKLRSQTRQIIEARKWSRETNADIFRCLTPDPVIVRPGKIIEVTRLSLSGKDEGPMEVPNYLGDAEIAHSIGPPGWPGLPEGARPSEIVVAALEALAIHENQLAADYRKSRRGRAAARGKVAANTDS